MDDVRLALESYLRGTSTMTIGIQMPSGENQLPITVQFSADPVMGQRLAFEMLRQLRRDEEFAIALRAFASRQNSAAGAGSTEA